MTIFYGYVNAESENLGSKNEKWVDLDGSKTLWLKINFNEDKPAITEFGLCRIPMDKKGRLVSLAQYSY